MLPDWLAILVVFRDVVIVGGVLVLGLSGQKVAIRPLLVSKLNTVLQIVLVALTLAMAATGWQWPLLTLALTGWWRRARWPRGAYVWTAARAR